jgi:hypothetical protein
MELLDHRRIAREPARVEALHLARQILNFLERRRIVLGQMVKLVQLRQPLPVGSVQDRPVRANCPERQGPPSDRSGCSRY